MRNLVIHGGTRLEGKLSVQGSKNSALPMMAAAVLGDGTTKLKNCPNINDVRSMRSILHSVGIKTDYDDSVMTIGQKRIGGEPDPKFCRELRASAIFMGALLASRGSFCLPYPGGCRIGKRPLNYHLDGLRLMGAEIREEDGLLYGRCDGLKGCVYRFPYPSVGALENLLIAAAAARGTSTFYNCSVEPEIEDLCNFLNRMGADVSGIGTDTLTVNGRKNLKGCRYTVPGDRIVAGTYLCACAVSGGNIILENAEVKRLRSLNEILKQMGCHLFTDAKRNEIILVSDGRHHNLSYIKTGPYPAFPTDLQPLMMSMAAYGTGTMVIEDTVFTNRYDLAQELNRMGARITVRDGKAVVSGVAKLSGRVVKALDLRQGAALAVAALHADGATVIRDCYHIERGYEDLQRDLSRLGADIRWAEEENKTDEKGNSTSDS